jgi:hypothetical protein
MPEQGQLFGEAKKPYGTIVVLSHYEILEKNESEELVFPD